MKAKLLKLLTFALLLSLTIFATACVSSEGFSETESIVEESMPLESESDEPAPDHEHSREFLKYDETYHWYECVCGATDGLEEHNFKDNKCVICGEYKFSKGLEYELNLGGKSYSVIGIGSCTDTDIIIPGFYEDLPITSIGDSAFYNCKSLTSVVIGDSVTSIGEGAFEYCYRLTSIVIPDSVTSIGDYAFYECSSLTSVVIGDSVKDIGYHVFGYCESLTSIVLPDSVKSIGSGALYECSSLTSIEVSEENEAYKSIDGNLYSKDGKTLVQYAIGKTDKEFVIPNSVTSIGDFAFEGCSSLTSVVIGYSVTSIGESAFQRCHSLTSIVIGDSVTSIGDFAFEGCSSLTSVVIGDSVTSIGDFAFYSCSSLTSIVIGDGVTSIGANAFYRCSGLTSVEIGDSVKGIGHGAFAHCSSLTSVYYKGTASEWAEISISPGNEYLTSATIYYV